MSAFGVDDGEMLKSRFSDQDIERLFSGAIPEDEGLASLAPHLESLLAKNWPSPSEERVARFAAEAAETAGSMRLRRAGTATPGRTTTPSRRFALAFRRKLATGLAAALLLSGLTGVAVASDHSAPGDALYGLDRALEAIGIGDGEAAERLDEARALLDQGRVAEALAHAAEAAAEVEVIEVEVENEVEVEQEDEPQSASDALIRAAQNVDDDEDPENDNKVRDRVANMLRAMALMLEVDGKIDGQSVAEMARGIGGAEEGDNGDSEGASENADQGLDTAEENADPDAEDGLDTARDATDSGGDQGADSAGSADDEGRSIADDASGGASNRP